MSQISKAKSINQKYNPTEIEAKWQAIWEKEKIYSPNLDTAKKPFYNLMMFPYPSAEGMHVGNMYAFTGADVYGRFQRMQGNDVFEPIGLDGFGIHSENYAIKQGAHPTKQAEISEKNYYKQLKSIGNGFDWSRTVETYKPEYYKWTQWLFIQLFKAGLAYRKKAPVNFCPSCKTVLADEQVEDGKCERCESIVEKKDLEQWFFKITKYADRLLNGLSQIDWSEKIKIAQKQWIGKSEGVRVNFELDKKFKYVFIHGHNGSIDKDFFPWLKQKLEKRGSEVEMHNLPGGTNPNIEIQVKFLLEKHTFDQDTIIIAHSLGCVDALKLLPKLKNKIYKLILIAPPLAPEFSDGKRRPELEIATDWKFDFEAIKGKASEIVVIRDTHDDVIVPAQPVEIANRLGAKLVDVKANTSHFNTKGEEISILKEAVAKINVFTTRPDTLFGATFLALSPSHPIVSSIDDSKVKKYVEEAKRKTNIERTGEKTGLPDEVLTKSGVFSGLYAINPVNNEKIPIWIADYILMGYGTGAIMAVPAHDNRDFEFAKKYKLSIKHVISSISSIVFVHGCPSSAEHCINLSEKSNARYWMIWAREKLRKLGYKVHNPIMPTPWMPKYEEWKKEFEKYHIDGNSVVVATSCGGSFIVRWLSETKRKIGKIILVAPAKQAAEGKNEKLEALKRFYDYEVNPNIKNYVQESIIMTSNDEERHLRSADLFEKALNAKRIRIEGKKHFVLEKLPEIIDLIIDSDRAYVGEGEMINSEDWNGWKTPESIEKVINWLEKRGLGKKEANYHLRDWLISRQRYWGPPIPMINCPKCGWQPVDEENLPVELPFIKDYKPLGTGVAPLASHPEFYKTTCPKCGGDAKRETDVSDTFLDSAWYFLKYVSTDIESTAFDAKRVKKWLPVNMYIGGAEHSVLHLLYSRFITMVLKDVGHISFEEPFTKFRAHGLIIKDGAKMSKSKGNIVIPDEYIRKFGADTLRTYLMFMGPFNQGGDFMDTGVEGMNRFLRRVWSLVSSIQYSVSSIEKKDTSPVLDSLMHKTIRDVTEDIKNLNYNTAIAHLMEYYNELSNFYTKYKILNTKYCKTLVLLLAPFAPHISEQVYQNVILSDNEGSHGILRSAQNDKSYMSIHVSSWPTYDPKFLVKDELIIVVQVNGKLRGNIKVDPATAKNKAKIEELARKDDNVKRHLEAKQVKKVIYVEEKVINFVVS